eukprot:GSMAST32.ASY1.ANO1.1904.1 assembled CDS
MLIRLYRQLSKKYVLSTAFATCFIKGSLSDGVAQIAVEKLFSFRRNLAFAFFSGVYLGCGQHFIYNVAFTRIFGSAQTMKVAFQKVAADLFVHTPLIYLPLYYAFQQTVVFGGTPMQGLRRFYGQVVPTMLNYAKIWPVVHFFNFTVTPPELRIAVVACVSFVWLVIVSTISHQQQDRFNINTEKNSNPKKEYKKE